MIHIHTVFDTILGLFSLMLFSVIALPFMVPYLFLDFVMSPWHIFEMGYDTTLFVQVGLDVASIILLAIILFLLLRREYLSAIATVLVGISLQAVGEFFTAGSDNGMTMILLPQAAILFILALCMVLRKRFS